MNIQLIWFMMIVLSVLWACATGRVDQVLPSMLKGCESAVSLTLQLGAGYLLFCGLMAVGEAAGLHRVVEKGFGPLLRLLMPSIRQEKTRQAAAVNLSMNVLGMGNAATPMGIEAVRRISAEAEIHPEIRHDLYMLLILNATSIQLLPTGILALRAAAGSASASAVVGPTLACTACSTLVGAGLGMLCRRWGR